MKVEDRILLFAVLTSMILAQNEVCFEIESNPNPLDPALSSFSKYVNVLDCFHVYAESSISDEKVLHAASVVAELLDNNEDGIVDDPLLEEELRSGEAMIPKFSSEWSPAMDDVWDYYDGCVSAALFNNEIDPSGREVIVLGAGGTAKSILFSLKQLGAKKIILLNLFQTRE